MEERDVYLRHLGEFVALAEAKGAGTDTFSPTAFLCLDDTETLKRGALFKAGLPTREAGGGDSEERAPRLAARGSSGKRRQRSPSAEVECYDCGRPGHYSTNCDYPRDILGERVSKHSAKFHPKNKWKLKRDARSGGRSSPRAGSPRGRSPRRSSPRGRSPSRR